MIAHHRMAPDRHPKNASQLVDPILNPLAPMLERPTRQPILAAEKSTSYAARHAVKGTGGAGLDQEGAGVGHEPIIDLNKAPVRRKKALVFVGNFLQSGCPLLLLESQRRRRLTAGAPSQSGCPEAAALKRRSLAGVARDFVVNMPSQWGRAN